MRSACRVSPPHWGLRSHAKPKSKCRNNFFAHKRWGCAVSAKAVLCKDGWRVAWCLIGLIGGLGVVDRATLAGAWAWCLMMMRWRLGETCVGGFEVGLYIRELIPPFTVVILFWYREHHIHCTILHHCITALFIQRLSTLTSCNHIS